MRGQSSSVEDAVMVLGDGAEVPVERRMVRRNAFPESEGEVVAGFRGDKVKASPAEYPI